MINKSEDTHISKKKMKMTTLYFGIELWQEVLRIADEEETSASELCRRWVREAVKQNKRKVK